MDDLLFLSHRIPYPPNKGEKIRAWHFLRHLTAHYRVHLACLIDDPADLEHVTKLEEICATVRWQRLVPSRAKLRSLGGILRGAPLTEGYFRDRRLQREVDRIIARHQPERFFVYSSAMASYIEHHRAERVVIDMVDVDSQKWQHYADVTGGLQRLLFTREARTLLAFERRSSLPADSVIFVSQAEADLFRRFAPEIGPRICHIENGVDSDYFSPNRIYANPFDRAPAIVFLGVMNYRPNVDAVQWFAAEVMPMLRSLAARPSFWIVGAHPNAAVCRLADSDVHVTGRVPDVRPYLAHAAAVVAPLRIARGVQNKVLEAMSMAAPVVVSPPAREGLEACAADEIIEADGAQAFVAAIERILVDGRRAGRKARERVRRNFTWASSLAALDAQLAPESSKVTPADKAKLAQTGYRPLQAEAQ